ncbi:transient receptor potential cation channel subfamily A member 1-like isoform X3 [Dendronephthya gigantea]|uniref:transient receptor potential cation channel subfamily A member 1-like isoform X3 n=1 Tax=Dendronephthya gigantea TaxID=151771 RepID=UPI00106BC33E|nr:transient receptor potential cation channel subfamily A member 1-like isoform X3 [Dendronephthya gigantea]
MDETRVAEKMESEQQTRSDIERSVRSARAVCYLNLKQLMSNVRRGVSASSAFFNETNLEDLDVKEIDSYGRNAFHYAVSRPNTLKKLLERVANKSSVDEALRQADKNGETPIHRAAIIGNVQSLEALYEYDNSLLKLKTTAGGKSVLHLAVKSRSAITVKFVLRKDPNLVNCVDDMLQNPVHCAAVLQSSILELLILNGADTTLTEINNKLPLHLAASQGLKSNVELLLRENPDFIDVTDNLHQSSLILAAQNNFPSVVSHLLSMGANHDIRDHNRLSAFDWAILNTSSEVVKVFLDTEVWKEVVNNSHHGPERCLGKMIESMPEMAKILLDKCMTTTSCNETGDRKVTYDFFCLEQTDEVISPNPKFEALDAMIENKSEICLGHPVAIKYINVKWIKRGFKFCLLSIFLNLIVHICLLTHVIFVVGQIGKNVTSNKLQRTSMKPNDPATFGLTIILLVVTFVALLKEVIQMRIQGFRYFTISAHYMEVVMRIIVVVYLLPIEEEVSLRHVSIGSIAVLHSWLTLIQYLKFVPVMGVYIIVVQRIFWTLLKVLLVVIIYLLSFSSTFYVLLTEKYSFRNIIMSAVTTFVAMTSGFEYSDNFVYYVPGWPHSEIYELKLVILILFILVMTIVVNNALIGLAVGDTDKVMKSAKFDKLKRRAQFVIHLEKSVNKIPCLRIEADKFHIAFSHEKKISNKKLMDFVNFGSQMDLVTERNEDLHDENKLESFRSSLQDEFKVLRDEIKENRKYFKQKIDLMQEKLNERVTDTRL